MIFNLQCIFDATKKSDLIGWYFFKVEAQVTLNLAKSHNSAFSPYVNCQVFHFYTKILFRTKKVSVLILYNYAEKRLR